MTNTKNKFLEMKEFKFEEGLSLNIFGENFDFEEKNLKLVILIKSLEQQLIF